LAQACSELVCEKMTRYGNMFRRSSPKLPDDSKPPVRRRPQSLVSLGENLSGTSASAGSGGSKSSGGRCAKLIAKVGRLLTPTSASRNGSSMFSQGWHGTLPISPKGWLSPKKSPKKYRRRLSSIELDRQFEDFFDGSTLNKDLPGSVENSPTKGQDFSHMSQDLKNHRRAHIARLQREDVLEDVVDERVLWLRDFEEVSLRTVRARTELRRLPALGNPVSFKHNASRVQEKLDKLKDLREELTMEP